MTIPSIGGNGESLSKIHINQPVEPVVNPEPDVAVDIQPQMDEQSIEQFLDLPAEQTDIEPVAIQQSEDFQSPEIAQQEENEVKTSVALEEEKEYSIAQFKKDYATLVETKVLPVLKDFEGERKKRLTCAVISATILGLIAFWLFFFVNPESASANRAVGKLAWGAAISAWLVWAWIKKSFEKKIKRLIMPTLMHAVPGFYWQETPPVTKEDIQGCMIVPFAKKLRYTFDDCFLGEYRGVKVGISECCCELGGGDNAKTVLEGVVIKFQMNKNFDGTTIIRPRKPKGYKDKYDDLKRANMSEVKLEDPEFDKKFVVYSTDQIEARYLITTSFMERFKQIEMAFESNYSYCSFYGNSVFIAPHTGKDLFNLCSLVKPIGNREQFETLFNEFASILELVDYFKLDKKLGL